VVGRIQLFFQPRQSVRLATNRSVLAEYETDAPTQGHCPGCPWSGRDVSWWEQGECKCKFNIMINNSGVYRGGKLIHVFSEAELDLCLNVNVKGTFFGSQAAVRAFLHQGGGGNIINLVSTAGLQGHPWQSVYNVSKGRPGQPDSLPGHRIRPRRHPRERYLPDVCQNRSDSRPDGAARVCRRLQ
jgi:hypothetical protein